jgi:hypothetical protein
MAIATYDFCFSTWQRVFSSWLELQPTGGYYITALKFVALVVPCYSHFILLVNRVLVVVDQAKFPRATAMCQCISFSTGTSLSQQARASAYAVIDLRKSRKLKMRRVLDYERCHDLGVVIACWYAIP